MADQAVNMKKALQSETKPTAILGGASERIFKISGHVEKTGISLLQDFVFMKLKS